MKSKKFARAMTDQHSLLRTILVWAMVLAGGAFGLQWLQYEYLVSLLQPQIYIALIGTAFAAGGVWVGWKLTSRAAPAPFARNTAAQASLGLTGQEMKVLPYDQLAASVPALS